MPELNNTPKQDFLHLSTYKFTTIHDVDYLKNTYWKLCFELQLKGAIVFSPEGFNLMMAGSIQNMNKLMDFLNQDPRFTDLPNKISYCDHNPFKRLQIKFKPLLVPTIDTKTKEDFPAPHLSPKDFKRWMDNNKTDSGEEFIILDTRNGFEYRKGAFTKSKHFDLTNFSDFKEAVTENKNNILPKKDVPIVTFCTGGIRCEKAAPHLIKEGYKNVYQLDGGVLDYFKDVGDSEDDHWSGDCFVFADRVAVRA